MGKQFSDEEIETLREIEKYWRAKLADEIVGAAPAESDLPSVRKIFLQCAQIVLDGSQ